MRETVAEGGRERERENERERTRQRQRQRQRQRGNGAVSERDSERKGEINTRERTGATRD